MGFHAGADGRLEGEGEELGTISEGGGEESFVGKEVGVGEGGEGRGSLPGGKVRDGWFGRVCFIDRCGQVEAFC